MRHAIAVLAVFVCAALTASAADDEKYTSKEGKFAILFPAGAKVKSDTKKTGDKIEMHTIAADAGAGKACVVLYFDLPALKMVPPAVYFDGAQKSAGKKEGDVVEDVKDFTHGKDKLPGREFVVVSKNGQKLKTRMIIDGERAYTLMIGDPADFAISKEATKVFESFEITK